MNWKIYSEEKPKSFKQVIAYNPKWRGDKIVLGYLDDSDIDEKFNYMLLMSSDQKFHTFEGKPTRWIDPEELIKDIESKGVFESFNHVFDTFFSSWNGN